MEYAQICRVLGLDPNSDEKATRALDSLIEKPDLKLLRDLISDKSVIVFGAGPSLKEDTQKFLGSGLMDKFTIIAVDGAVQALLEDDILPNINVTDLDGDIDSIIEANRRGTLTVVHAHGDNISVVKKIMPKLEGRVIGTTQVKPTAKVLNFGGFTDGDRAVYLALRFKPKFIVLAGMDFGSNIGSYSEDYNPQTKLKKLEIGKHLIEEAAAKTTIVLFNMTSNGVELKGTIRKNICELVFP